MSSPLPPPNWNNGPSTPAEGATGGTTSARRRHRTLIACGGAFALAAAGLLGGIAIGTDQPSAPTVSTATTTTPSPGTTTSTPIRTTTTTPLPPTTTPSDDTVIVLPPHGDEQPGMDNPPLVATPTPSPAPESTAPQTTFQPEPSLPALAPFRSCAAARAAGAAPLHRGDPGYSSALDRDGDGVACETGR